MATQKSEALVFRKLHAQDLEAYHAIRLASLKRHPENFGMLYEEQVKEGTFKFDTVIAHSHPTDFLMGAFIEGTLTGICVFLQEKRQKTKHTGEISQLCVVDTQDGKGVGTALLQTTIHAAFQHPELEQIILAVAAKNVAAQRQYQKLGFQEYGKLKNYFQCGRRYDDNVLMILTKLTL